MSIVFRHLFFILACSCYFNNFCYAIINIHQEAVQRETTDLRIAQNIADNILHINVGHRTKFDHGLDTIMRDHSESRHHVGDSYFRTDDVNAIRELIRFVIRDADTFDFYNRGGRDRLTIRKTISEDDSNRIF